MIYRGQIIFLLPITKVRQLTPVKYFAAPENQDLGIVKRAFSKTQY